MTDVTYVAFVPRSKRAKLHDILTREDTGPIAWQEKRGLFRSEFHFSGPAGLVRRVHAYVTDWVAREL
jgi:hypothetical protein